MKIKEITKNKSRFIDLLLIGDEEESMINKYLEESTLFTLYDNDILISVCAVVIKDSDTIEIKNLATYPKYQNKGYASTLMGFVLNKYKKEFKYLILGTGENPKTLDFYKKRGFKEYKRVKDFFTENYALDIETLCTFVKNTQPVQWALFEKRCKSDPQKKFYKAFQNAVDMEGLVNVLRHGF